MNFLSSLKYNKIEYARPFAVGSAFGILHTLHRRARWGVKSGSFTHSTKRYKQSSDSNSDSSAMAPVKKHSKTRSISVRRSTSLSRGRTPSRSRSRASSMMRTPSRTASRSTARSSGLSDVSVSSTVEEVHGELKYHTYNIGKPRKLKESKGMWIVEEQAGSFASSTEGSQLVQQVLTVDNVSQMTVSTGNSGSNGYTTTIVDLFSSNPNQNITEGTLYSALPTQSVTLDDRVIHDKTIITLRIANFTVGIPVSLEIFIVKHKITSNNPFVSQWNTWLQGAALGKSLAAQPTVSAYGSPGYPTANFLDQRPWALPQFKKSFHLLHHKKYTLASSAQMILTYNFNVHKLIEKNVVSQSAGTYMGGYTYEMVVLLAGGIVLEGTNGVTIGKAEIGTVLSRKTYAHVSKQSRNVSDYVNPYLINSATPAPKAINDVDVAAAVTTLI